MQFIRLNETCRMIGYSLLSNDVNFVEIGFKWLCCKTTFWCVPMRISPTSPFFLGKKFGGTRHPCEKNELTLDHSERGVHGKVCWLIVYHQIQKIFGVEYLQTSKKCCRIR